MTTYDQGDMNFNTALTIFVTSFVWFVACMIFYAKGISHGIDSTRQEAVDSGAAEWSVSSEGDVSIRWRPFSE